MYLNHSLVAFALGSLSVLFVADLIRRHEMTHRIRMQTLKVPRKDQYAFAERVSRHLANLKKDSRLAGYKVTGREDNLVRSLVSLELGAGDAAILVVIDIRGDEYCRVAIILNGSLEHNFYRSDREFPNNVFACLTSHADKLKKAVPAA